MSHPNSIFIAPSSEFVALCQSQITLLTQGLNAAWSAVYLTEGLGERSGANLIPVVVYPSGDPLWQDTAYFRELEDTPLLLPEGVNFSEDEIQKHSSTSARTNNSLRGRHQVVLPLIYEELFIGLLVTGHKDREWNQEELAQIEKIAETLAIARLLDQRQSWYQEQFNQQQAIRSMEHNRLDDLLHQLRNPLTALRTFSKLLIKRLLPEDPNQSFIQGMLRESDRLQELLQEFESESEQIEASASGVTLSTSSVRLSDSAAISNSPFLLAGSSLNLQAVTISEVLEPLLISAEAIAQERGIDLIADIPRNLPPVKANYKALREVFNNLIDNALKYTPVSGKINIEIATISSPKNPEDELWQGIVIRDTGYGIPVEDHKRLFERHYRGVQAQGDIPGTGLGLAIAKELVEQMQGKIELISPNLSSQENTFLGTTFIIWLPVAEV